MFMSIPFFGGENSLFCTERWDGPGREFSLQAILSRVAFLHPQPSRRKGKSAVLSSVSTLGKNKGVSCTCEEKAELKTAEEACPQGSGCRGYSHRRYWGWSGAGSWGRRPARPCCACFRKGSRVEVPQVERPQKNPHSCPHKTHMWIPSTTMDSKEHRLRKRASVSLLEVHPCFPP